MAHYALLDENNVVVNVITGLDETELIEGLSPEEWYGNFHNQTCVRTSYNNNIRKQYAIIGGIYDPTADVFILPKPYPTWVLNEAHDWEPPVPKPVTDGYWEWDEGDQSWKRLWVLNETHDWEPPVPKPITDGYWEWHEGDQSWKR
jgi:hypothetical protein